MDISPTVAVASLECVPPGFDRQRYVGKPYIYSDRLPGVKQRFGKTLNKSVDHLSGMPIA
jgi:hypothetical protein